MWALDVTKEGSTYCVRLATSPSPFMIHELCFYVNLFFRDYASETIEEVCSINVHKAEFLHKVQEAVFGGYTFRIKKITPDSTDQALRYNSGKPQLSFILEAPKAIEGTARVLEFGAQKYDRGNWKKGLPKEQIVDSLLRHLTKYMNGEEFDEESGHHHVYHVMCNAMFLAELYGKEKEV